MGESNEQVHGRLGIKRNNWVDRVKGEKERREEGHTPSEMKRTNESRMRTLLFIREKYK
jgi:hypothetical protein